jgi:orotate phosphoribosyltransferase
MLSRILKEYVPLSNKEVLEILERAGAIKKGHYVLASSRHSIWYVEKLEVLMSSEHLQIICRETAYRCLNEGIEVVAGPATAGIPLAVGVARELRDFTGKNILNVYTEKNIDRRHELKSEVFKKAVKGKTVLVTEDIGTTGASAKEVALRCFEAGASRVIISFLLDRSNGEITAENLGVDRVLSLAEFHVETYRVDESKGICECPSCKENVEIDIEHGHGAEYLKKILERKNEEGGGVFS